MGGQTKGSEMAVVFTTMDGSLGEKKIRSRKKKKRKVPWLLRKDALATGAGKAADIATVANAFNSYHPNCVPQDMQESMVRNIVAEPHIKHLWYCSNSISFWLST